VRSTQLVGYLAFLCGFAARGRACTPGELLRDFDLARLPRGPVRGDDPPFS
jgi:hypothetical protein